MKWTSLASPTRSSMPRRLTWPSTATWTRALSWSPSQSRSRMPGYFASSALTTCRTLAPGTSTRSAPAVRSRSRAGMKTVATSGSLAVPLVAHEQVGAEDQEDREQAGHDRQVDQRAGQHDPRVLRPVEVVGAARQVDRVAQRREPRQQVEQPGQPIDRVEDASQEELRQHHEREDLVGRPLGRDVGKHHHAEGPAEEADHDGDWQQADQLRAGEADAEHEPEQQDRAALHQRDQRLAGDLAEHD